MHFKGWMAIEGIDADAITIYLDKKKHDCLWHDNMFNDSAETMDHFY